MFSAGVVLAFLSGFWAGFWAGLVLPADWRWRMVGGLGVFGLWAGILFVLLVVRGDEVYVAATHAGLAGVLFAMASRAALSRIEASRGQDWNRGARAVGAVLALVVSFAGFTVLAIGFDLVLDWVFA